MTETQTDEARLAEIAERLAKATRGPWHHSDVIGYRKVGNREYWLFTADHSAGHGVQAEADAAFIAAAPTDIAWLLKLVGRQQEWIRQAEDRMQYMSDSLRSDWL